jgi:hypothetical protein
MAVSHWSIYRLYATYPPTQALADLFGGGNPAQGCLFSFVHMNTAESWLNLALLPEHFKSKTIG